MGRWPCTPTASALAGRGAPSVAFIARDCGDVAYELTDKESMPTIERRVTDLERSHTGICGAAPLVVLQGEAESNSRQATAVEDARRAGRQVITVRFVKPEKATKEQQT